jgi:acyl-coenzyme A thioesterase PaaI-like protein
MKQRFLRWINWWPPYLGSGVKVRRISEDFREVDVEMVQRFWNTNYVGVHFGGSLFAMTDPFYMLMLMENLGPQYIVWDKAASIRFRKPAKGKVRAEFRLSAAQIDEVRQAAETQAKVEPVFVVQIKDRDGDVVAEAERTLHVRKKKPLLITSGLPG